MAQNVLHSGGSKGISARSEVIRRRLQCEFNHHDLLCARVGLHVRIAYLRIVVSLADGAIAPVRFPLRSI